MSSIPRKERYRHIAAGLRRKLTAGPGDHLVPRPGDIPISRDYAAWLTAKYDEERDKRLDAQSAAGQGQYERIVDLAQAGDQRFVRMLADPYPKIDTPVRKGDAVEVCIVGTGFGGLCAGARLVRAGIDPKTIRLVDMSGDVGGTW